MNPRMTLFSIVWLLIAGAALALDAQPAPRAATEGAGAHPTLEGAEPVGGQSLYQLTLDLEDQDGQTLGLDHHRGHPVLISLFYASCPSACPLLIRDLKQLEGALAPELRKDVRILLVSIDPGSDTPTALKAAAKAHTVDEARWRLTRAPDLQVRSLAAVLGIKYRRDPSGAIGHTSRITLLDREGVPVSHIDGLGQPADALISALKALDAPRGQDKGKDP